MPEPTEAACEAAHQRLIAEHPDIDFSCFITRGQGGGGGGYHDAFAGEEAEARLRDAEGAQVMRIVGAKTFYRDGERWVDSVYTATDKPKPQTVKIKLYSDAYFELTRRHPEAAKYLALGPRVVVVLDGKAYETVEP